MKYMMFVATDAEPDRLPEAPHEIEDWLSDVDGRGKRVIGDRLRPKQEAKTVRVRSGKVLVTDGPFADSKEVIVGFDILDCETMEEADRDRVKASDGPRRSARDQSNSGPSRNDDRSQIRNVRSLRHRAGARRTRVRPAHLRQPQVLAPGTSRTATATSMPASGKRLPANGASSMTNGSSATSSPAPRSSPRTTARLARSNPATAS